MNEMNEILEYKGWIVLASFVLLVGLEYFFPSVKIKAHSIGRIIKNLSFWPINIGLSLAVILPVSYFAVHHAFWVRPQWLLGFSGLGFDILFLDFFIFWWHRASHKIPLLWRFHLVHHLDEHLDTSSAIRFHFGEIFFAVFARAVVIMVLAIPFNSVIIFEILVLVFTLFHHSNIAIPARFSRNLSKIIITPEIHWVHHHAVQKDTDSNYGTILSIWDRIFATRSTTSRFQSMKIGVEGYKDKGFLKLLLTPFYQK